ncbi:MAG: hypothetical protein U0Y10_08540 [Spirosomataceae bacterium]
MKKTVKTLTLKTDTIVSLTMMQAQQVKGAGKPIGQSWTCPGQSACNS